MTRPLASVAVAVLLLTGAPGCARGGAAAATDPVALAARIEAGTAPRVLDVRTPEEFARGHVPGAANAPVAELATQLPALGLAPDDEIVVYCESGRRAEAAAETLRGAGFTHVTLLEGHMRAWRAEARPCSGC